MLHKTRIKILITTVLLALPLMVFADSLGQQTSFFVDSSYDEKGRSEITATLQEKSSQLYFYIDNDWWNGFGVNHQDEIKSALSALSSTFEKEIYPILTSAFGSEWKPGIDNDPRITILVHPMREDAGGYFNPSDEYPKTQNPKSNEREMIYFNAKHLTKPIAKSYLAHEFVHLITFNQKEKIRGVEEEVWLNEARADFAPTLLGYDDAYSGSNLEARVKSFLAKPSDSLTEWLNKKYDYGIANLFTQYLVDHYGLKILVDSLHSSKSGIPSINEALSKNGFQEDFSKIFTDWLIAVLMNDCSFGEKYCYKNPNLKNFRVVPEINFLPLAGESALTTTRALKDWEGIWQKIVGGEGTLTLEFDGDDRVNFQVPYLLCDYQQKCELHFLGLDKEQKGKIEISQFGTEYSFLIIIPSIQTKISGFEGEEPFYPFSWKASIVKKTPEEKEAELKAKLLAQIAFLKKEIAKVQAKINAILTERQKIGRCTFFAHNLYFGMKNNPEVLCLQEFLKAQGPEIYPEGLVTGYFGPLTRAAVIRFQEKYALEILKPLGLQKGTGYVGKMTRSKINHLLNP